MQQVLSRGITGGYVSNNNRSYLVGEWQKCQAESFYILRLSFMTPRNYGKTIKAVVHERFKPSLELMRASPMPPLLSQFRSPKPPRQTVEPRWLGPGSSFLL